MQFKSEINGAEAISTIFGRWSKFTQRGEYEVGNCGVAISEDVVDIDGADVFDFAGIMEIGDNVPHKVTGAKSCGIVERCGENVEAPGLAWVESKRTSD